MSEGNFTKGSEWRCWDLHIHTPGTTLASQYGGDSDEIWDKFLTQIEDNKEIKVIGITDYMSLENYAKVVEYKRSGRLPNIDLIIPNIEFRITPETQKSKGINIHILSSPESKDHIQNLNEALSRLSIKLEGQPYGCCRSSFISIGQKRNSSLSIEAAYKEGVNQFKVSFEVFRDWFNDEGLVKNNSLIAISNSTNDGVSGIQNDGGFAEIRDEIYRFSDIIFSARPKERGYFLGNEVDNKKTIVKRFGSLKPCLHGSDAHSFDKLLKPDQDRFCWIKADTTFEGLKQVIVEPESRVFIGNEVPLSSMPSYTIESVAIDGASWIKNKNIQLNSGLVAIIGSRGSGKTALADLIATGGYSSIQRGNKESFINRAGKLFSKESVKLKWVSGEKSSQKLNGDYGLDQSKVQYLSQQFVDLLCSSEGLAEELMSEIERVIFEAHKPIDRIGTSSFEDLLELKLNSIIGTRKNYEEQIKDYTSSFNILREKKSNVAFLSKALEEKKKRIQGDKKDRENLIKNNKSDVTSAYKIIADMLDKLKTKLDVVTRKKMLLSNLMKEVISSEESLFPNHLRKLKEQYQDIKFDDNNWQKFELVFKGDVRKLILDEIKEIEKDVSRITGDKINIEITTQTKPMISDYDNISSDVSYNLLKFEQERLEKVIGINKENSLKVKKLTEKVTKGETEYSSLEKELNEIKSSDKQVASLRDIRREAHKGVFQTIIEHEKILSDLYEPLMISLKDADGAIGKLTFSVQRTVNIDKWCEEGESLLDLRKGNKFRGRGELKKIVEKELLPILENNLADNISQEMSKFMQEHYSSFEEHCPLDGSDKKSFVEWQNKLAAWFYSTSHISIKYGVQYDGTDIKQLSPGTRGIVLLLLYLDIDKEDYRPLIIDQPEENLDPKSIFDELVTKFRVAKLRRQIIIVTHNANLVVNTDADQVIIATCGSNKPNQLPDINYLSGSLENAEIRQKVCEILEGGEEAFKERAKRLRVAI